MNDIVQKVLLLDGLIIGIIVMLITLKEFHTELNKELSRKTK